jgi:hypothetical protein
VSESKRQSRRDAAVGNPRIGESGVKGGREREKRIAVSGSCGDPFFLHDYLTIGYSFGFLSPPASISF